MPITKYEFDANTEYDIDVIRWIDSFSPEERSMAIRGAIRDHMEMVAKIEEPLSIQEFSAGRIDEMEETLAEILRQLVDIRKSGISIMQKQKKTEDGDDIENYNTKLASENLNKLFN